ncbi:hypothetical protein [Helicobacter mustelae]|nr:hypothetical protein [Helicobacter mustelae]
MLKSPLFDGGFDEFLCVLATPRSMGDNKPWVKIPVLARIVV